LSRDRDGDEGVRNVIAGKELFQSVADRAGVPLDLNPLLIEIFRDGIARFGPRELSPNIIRRLEEATGLDIRAPGFPAEMVDDEPEAPGAEVVVRRAGPLPNRVSRAGETRYRVLPKGQATAENPWTTRYSDA
jgi:hypothetical protein